MLEAEKAVSDSILVTIKVIQISDGNNIDRGTGNIDLSYFIS